LSASPLVRKSGEVNVPMYAFDTLRGIGLALGRGEGQVGADRAHRGERLAAHRQQVGVQELVGRGVEVPRQHSSSLVRPAAAASAKIAW
jgi:hypothetical protein